MLIINDQGFEKYTLTERSNGRNTFSLACSFDFAEKIKIFDTVFIDGVSYVIDEINSDGEEMTVIGTTDLRELKAFEVPPFTGEFPVSELLAKCKLKAEGFTTTRLAIDFRGGTAYDLFKEIGAKERVGLKKLENGSFYVHDFIEGKNIEPTVLAHKRLNILSFSFKEDVLEYYNEIIVYGKNGIKAIATKNETPKLIKVIHDERFSDGQALQAFAESLLKDHGKSLKSYEISLADLSKFSTLYKKVELFDNVAYMGELSDGENHTVWEIERTPNGDTVKLANKRLNFSSLWDKYEEKMKNETQKLNNDFQSHQALTERNFENVNQNISQSIQASNQDLTSKITQTENRISLRVQSAENTIAGHTNKLSQIEQEAGSIRLSVQEAQRTADSNTLKISQINQNAESLKLTVQEVQRQANSNKSDIASLEMTASSIRSTVSSVKYTADASYRKSSAVEQTVDGFRVTIQEHGRKLEPFSVGGNGVRVQGMISVTGGINTYGSSIYAGYIGADSGHISGNLTVGGTFRIAQKDHVPGA